MRASASESSVCSEQNAFAKSAATVTKPFRGGKLSSAVPRTRRASADCVTGLITLVCALGSLLEHVREPSALGGRPIGRRGRGGFRLRLGGGGRRGRGCGWLGSGRRASWRALGVDRGRLRRTVGPAEQKPCDE